MGNINPLFRCHALAVGRLFVNLLNSFRRMLSFLPRVDVFADVIPLQVHTCCTFINWCTFVLSVMTTVSHGNRRTAVNSLLCYVCGIRTDALRFTIVIFCVAAVLYGHIPFSNVGRITDCPEYSFVGFLWFRAHVSIFPCLVLLLSPSKPVANTW